jgi:hypothetical protein
MKGKEEDLEHSVSEYPGKLSSLSLHTFSTLIATASAIAGLETTIERGSA